VVKRDDDRSDRAALKVEVTTESSPPSLERTIFFSTTLADCGFLGFPWRGFGDS